MREGDLERIAQLKDLSDQDLAEVIIDCLRPALLRNAARIKASSIESDFKTAFRLYINADFSDAQNIAMESTGCIEPLVFEAVKLRKPW